MKKLNLNSQIRVKLTDYGEYIYFHRFDECNKFIEKNGGTPLSPSYPEKDDNGLTEFLLWKFIELYGPYIHMGAKNVIVPLDIYVDDYDLVTVKDE